MGKLSCSLAGAVLSLSMSLPFLSSSISFSSISLFALLSPSTASAWDNGGETKRGYSNPKYGVHDWIAEEAVNMLKENESSTEYGLLKEDEYSWINITYLLLGTEAPDNKAVANKVLGKTLAEGYGDPVNHHEYVDNAGNVIDDSAGRRANEEYYKSLRALVDGDYEHASFYLGAMIHYLSDLMGWAHVMGSGSVHDSEDPPEHVEFEKSVAKTISAKKMKDPNHTSTLFQRFISFDGELERIRAIEAAARITLRTNRGERYSCVEMQRMLPMGKRGNGGYVDCSDWSEDYINEIGGTLNYGTNIIAGVIHTLNLDAHDILTSSSPSSSNSSSSSLLLNARD